MFLVVVLCTLYLPYLQCFGMTTINDVSYSYSSKSHPYKGTTNTWTQATTDAIKSTDYKETSTNDFVTDIQLVPLALSSDSPQNVIHKDLMKFFHWKNDLFCVATFGSSSTLYSVVFSYQQIYFDEILRLPQTPSFDKVNFLEIMVSEKVLWVFQGNIHSNLLVVIKINIGNVWHESELLQILPLQNLISGFIPFLSMENYLYLLVVPQVDSEGENQSVLVGRLIKSLERIKLFKLNEKLFEEESKFGFSVPKSEAIKITKFTHQNSVYLSLIDETGVGGIYQFHSKNSSLKEVYKLPQDSSVLVPLGASHRERSLDQLLLLLKKSGRNEVLLLQDESYGFWKIFENDSFFRTGVLKSLDDVDYLLLASDNRISVYLNPKLNSSQSFILESPCEKILHLEAEVQNGRLLVATFCASGEEITERKFSYLEVFVEDDDFQSDVPFVSNVPDIEKCLDELDLALRRQRPFIRDLQSILDDKLFLTDASDQVISQPVHFNHVQTENIEAQNMFLQMPEELKNLNLPVDELSARIMLLNTRMKFVESQLPTLLTYGKDQQVTVSVKMNKLTANSSRIFGIDVRKLNEFPVEDFKNKFLRLDDDQEITTNVVLDKVNTINLQTESLSSKTVSIYPNDFLDTRNPDQIITGHHSFSSLEVTNNIERGTTTKPLMVNGIATDELVTSTSPEVSFSGTKTFEKPLYVAQSIKMNSLNDVNYDSWHSSLLRMDGDSKVSVPGSMIVQGSVDVKGNVKVLSVNGIDLQKFSEQVAKKNEKYQIIEGPVEFLKPLSVAKLQVKEVNDVPWGDYLRISNSTVNAKFFIDEAVVVGDLNSDFINGIDFDKETVLTDTDQTVDGVIQFGLSVDVTGPEGVTMGVGATINGIDPSVHRPFGTGLNLKVVNKELNFGHAVQFNKDVQISYLNGQQFPDLQNGYWRKSVSQKIPVDLTVDSVEFKKDIFVRSLNGLKLNEYLQTDIDQTLTGRNYFTNVVEVFHDVELKDGKVFDGVRLPELRDKAVRLQGRQSIYAPVKFDGGLNVENLVIKNGNLNDIDIHGEFVYGNDSLTLDVATFSNWIWTDSFNVLGSLQVQYINERKANKILKPKPNPISEIDGNLYLDDLQVKEMTVGGRISGIDFNKWIKRTISKDSFSSLSFMKNVSVDGAVLFEGPLEIERINHKEFDYYLEQIAETCDGCFIEGTKRFSQPLNVFGNLTIESVNGIDLVSLQSRLLSRSSPQKITGKYTFAGGVSADEVKVPKISEFPVEDIALIDEVTNLKRTTVFASYVTFVQVLAPHNWLDGCNFDAVFNSPRFKTGDIILSDVSLGHLKVNGNISTDERILSGRDNVDVFSFLDRVVRRSTDQDISGDTLFQGVTFVRNMDTDFINKVPVKEIMERLAQNITNVELHCDIKFLEPVTIKNMTVDDVITTSPFLVNGLSVLNIFDSGVKRGSTGVVKGLKSISRLSVRGNLSADNFNRIPFDQLIRIDDKFYGKLKFLNYLTIGGNLKVNGLIAQTDPEELFRHFSNSKNEGYLSIFPPKYNLLEIKGDLIVNSINGLPLHDLVLTHGKPQMITGVKTFLGGLTPDGGANIDVINDIDLNQFRKFNDFQSRNLLERSLEYPFEFPAEYEMSSLMRRTYLEKTAFRLRRHNDLNFQLAKTLHQELVSLKLLSQLWVTGVIGLLPFQPLFGNKISAMTNSEGGCASGGVFTFNFEISKDQKLQKLADFYGLRIVVHIPEVNELIYDFITPCGKENVRDTIIRKLDFETNVIDLKRYELGTIRKIRHFVVNSRVYFVMLSTSLAEKDGYKFRLTVMKANDGFKIVWKKTPLIKAKDFDLYEINGIWTLVVGGEYLGHSYSTGYQSESILYHWSDHHESFDVVGHLESATSVEFIAYRDDLLLILGQTRETSSQRGRHAVEHNMKVYKKQWNAMTFLPYNSIPMNDVTGTKAFVVSSDLYVAAFSNQEESIRIFKMVAMEGFKEVQSFPVENPTSILYIAEGGKNLLVVASDIKIILLELNFRGVDGNLVRNSITKDRET